MSYLSSNLENKIWTPASGADINDPPADAIQAVTIVDEDGSPALEVTMIASKQNAGSLVFYDDAIPIVNGMPLQNLTVTWFVKPSTAAFKFARLYELDAMPVFPAALDPNVAVINRYNGSLQYLRPTGTYQIGNWQNTSFTAPDFPANVWNKVEVTYKFDWVAQTITIVSISQNGITQQIGVTFPAVSSNWALDVNGTRQPLLHLQIQECNDQIINAAYSVRVRCSALWS